MWCKVGVPPAPVIARFVPSALKTANFCDAATTLAPWSAIKTITSSLPAPLACQTPPFASLICLFLLHQENCEGFGFGFWGFDFGFWDFDFCYRPF